jgi:hypothetical protein
MLPDRLTCTPRDRTGATGLAGADGAGEPRRADRYRSRRTGSSIVPGRPIAEIDAVELAEDTELLATVRQAYEDNEPLPLR